MPSPREARGDGHVELGARGQVTFGGRLEPSVRGFPASAMAKKTAGDWRDRDHVHSWASGVAEDSAGSDGFGASVS